jgi:hypothetical protein
VHNPSQVQEDNSLDDSRCIKKRKQKQFLTQGWWSGLRLITGQLKQEGYPQRISRERKFGVIYLVVNYSIIPTVAQRWIASEKLEAADKCKYTWIVDEFYKNLYLAVASVVIFSYMQQLTIY